MQKILIGISFLILTLQGFSQVTYTWRYYHKPAGAVEGYFLVGMPSDSANGVKRPGIFMFPGNGETGSGKTTLANAIKFGPHKDVYNGLTDGGVVQSNGYADSVVYPIYINLQSDDADGSIGNVSNLRNYFNTVLNDYISYLDTSQLHVSALSIGGREILLSLVNYGGSAGANYTYANKFASAFISSAGGKTANITSNATALGSWAVKGGRMVYQTGWQDTSSRYSPYELIGYMNDSVANSAIGHKWTTGEGFLTEGHGGWDTLWRFDNRHYWVLDRFGDSVEARRWQLQFTKYPQAVAQTTINTTSSSITLNGVSNGWFRARSWTKQSGPTASITSSTLDTTAVSLSGGYGTYVFRFTVTNTTTSATATHDVTVNYTSPTGPPTANAGSDQSITVSSATLTGSGTPDGSETITGYAWTKQSGPAGGSITSPSSATTSVTSLPVGTHVFRLTVTQSDAQTDTDDITVTVTGSGEEGVLLNVNKLSKPSVH